MDLPAGVYKVTTTARDFMFMPFRCASFMVQSGKETFLHISLIPSGVTSHTTAHPPKLGYESIDLPNSPLELLVRFGNRQERGTTIEYRGVMITYDALTLFGDTARLNTKDSHFEVGGDVLVEDGKQSTRVRKAFVEFRAGKPNITLTKGAIDEVKGEGSIDRDTIDFTFHVKADSSGHISYTDKASRITFISKSIYSFRVTDDDP